MLYLSFSDMIDRWSLDFCQQVATLFSTQQQEMQRGNTPTFFHRVAECAKGRGYPINTEVHKFTQIIPVNFPDLNIDTLSLILIEIRSYV